ncbi:MAG: nucleotidyltransferase family protein [Patescibacteria group bacterium]|nr:nucleotidyltransferase family protein [Patescibacteria group bacterium]
MDIEEVKKLIIPILERNRVAYAGVFGSVARGQARPDSDVDILVKFSGPATFAAYLKLDDELRSSLLKDIDLVTEGAINKFLKPQIEKDIKIIYGQR